jgi:ABC-2 type transport system permease protein
MRVIYALWARQIKRYLRARSRIIGALGQPLLLLLALGYGLGSAFEPSGSGNYMDFLVPGVMAQTVLFTAVFYGINVIFDKQFGFLKETLVAPVSRFKIMIGGALGGATTSLIQGALVFVIALCLGVQPHSWLMLPLAVLAMFMLAVALTSFSSGVASVVNDVPGFQAINQFLIFPLFFLSGSLYPLNTAPRPLQIIANVNPISYAVDALRICLVGFGHYGLPLDFAVLGITLIVLVAFGSYRFTKIQA